jgi:hypothetical protein
MVSRLTQHRTVLRNDGVKSARVDADGTSAFAGESDAWRESLAYGSSPSAGAAASTLRSVCAAPSRPADSNGTTIFALSLSANLARASS